MSFPGKIFLPFRLKLLLAMLAAAGAGIYLSYSGFTSALDRFAQEETGKHLLARLDLAAALIDEDVKSSLERARLTAARTGLREILSRHNTNGANPADAGELSRRLADAAGASESITGLDLEDARGIVAASLEKANMGRDLSSRPDFRLGAKKHSISGPRWEKGVISYEVAVPVPALPGAAARPLGTLRCRFKVMPAQQAALRALRGGGAALVLAKSAGRRVLILEGSSPEREIRLESPEAAPFLPALSGKDGVLAVDGGVSGKALYACRPISAPDWVIAAKTPFSPPAGRAGKLLEGAWLNAALAFVVLALAAFFTVNLLAAPLCEAGRQVAFLLEQCGKPAGDKKNLCEPGILAGAIEEAAGMLKNQASRDIELETETEKLREEDADLKSQNEELEKLNKYLMEREIKISELKKEIDDLREKMGGAIQE